MSISPSDSRIFGPSFSTENALAAFSDQRFLEYTLRVEVVLAQVQARLGIIPKKSALQIAKTTREFEPDWKRLAVATQRDAFPVNDLVAQLREVLEGDAANHLHLGATTQDVVDTARVLQIRAALKTEENNLEELIEALARLADHHRETLMAGRTHAQQALPITFGFKVAGWLAPFLRHRQRLEQLKPRLFVLQLGGGVGTLSVLGEKGPEVQTALAAALDMGLPPMPWHSQRDSLVEFADWLALLSGSLGSIAQDVILLSQSEVAEVSEGAAGRSSAMPQKRNPVQSELILGAARHTAALLASMHQSLSQDHERGALGWQLEWLSLPQMYALTASALEKTLHLLAGLQVHADRMRANMKVGLGLMLAEGISMALSAHMPRTEAAALVREASRKAVEDNRPLPDVVREQIDLDLDWAALSDEANHLGSLNQTIDRVLAASEVEKRQS